MLTFICRKTSFKLQNYDVMVRGSWTADLLFLWEKTLGQRIRVGAVRSSGSATSGENSKEIAGAVNFDTLLEDDVFLASLADLEKWDSGEMDEMFEGEYSP